VCPGPCASATHAVEETRLPLLVLLNCLPPYDTRRRVGVLPGEADDGPSPAAGGLTSAYISHRIRPVVVKTADLPPILINFAPPGSNSKITPSTTTLFPDVLVSLESSCIEAGIRVLRVRTGLGRAANSFLRPSAMLCMIRTIRSGRSAHLFSAVIRLMLPVLLVLTQL
jgi:hypothetical protein